MNRKKKTAVKIILTAVLTIVMIMSTVMPVFAAELPVPGEDGAQTVCTEEGAAEAEVKTDEPEKGTADGTGMVNDPERITAPMTGQAADPAEDESDGSAQAADPAEDPAAEEKIVAAGIGMTTVFYYDAEGLLKSRISYTEITDSTEQLSRNWYVLKENVDLSEKTSFVISNANLILCDGATLTLGKTVNYDDLNIYAGSTSSMTPKGTGAIKLKGDYYLASYINNSGESFPAHTFMYGGQFLGNRYIVTSHNNCSFTLKKGYIDNSVEAKSGGSFTMNGGEVTSSIEVKSGGTFTMNGGTVSGMTGVVVDNGEFRMTGGTVSAQIIAVKAIGGTFKLSGNPTISGDENDIYLGNTVITVAGAINTGEKISVASAAGAGQFTTGFAANNPGKEPADVFVSADDAYFVRSGSGEGVLEAEDRVPYVDAHGNRIEPEYCVYVTQDTTELSNGWYAVKENITTDSRINVSGTVNLILCDGRALTAESGIHVPPDATLIIWAQKGGSGTLAAEALYSDDAAVGGNYGEDAGTIIINGGIVKTSADDGAGIGGGVAGSGGTLTVNGGTVEAESEYGAAIGGGNRNPYVYGPGGNGGNVTVNGGSVTAVGRNNYATGIGGGKFCEKGGSFTIYGGTVKAQGGSQAAGIGGSIGDRGEGGNGAVVKISGGRVEARGGWNAKAVGGGDQSGGDGSFELAFSEAKVTAGSNDAGLTVQVPADRVDACTTKGIVIIEPCDHFVVNNRCVWCGAEGVSTGTDHYEIYGESEWKTLAYFIEKGGKTNGITVLLKNDAEITDGIMLGTGSNRFNGIFDGGGHTLTFNISNAPEECAPVRYVGSAEFRNLTVAGTISTGEKYAAGMVSDVNGSCRIKNCVSKVTINSSVVGDGSHGGFVSTGENVIIEDSDFKGSIVGSNTTYCGGFMGWDRDPNNSNCINCLFDGTIDIKGTAATFIRNHEAATNSYYTKTVKGDRNFGRQGYTVTGTGGVTLSLNGTPGITRGETIYAGAGETVSLQISGGMPETGNYVYAANAGTLSQTGSGWSLTMPAGGVVISAAPSGPPSVPQFTVQPEPVKLTYGYKDQKTLRAEASADADCTLSYQWYRYSKADKSDLEAVAGAESGEYVIPPGLSAGTYYYYCESTAYRAFDNQTTAPAASDAAKVTVAKRKVTVTAADAADVAYDGSEHTGESTLKYTGLLSGHKASITYEPARGTDPGKYTGSFGNDFKVVDGDKKNVTGNYNLSEKTAGSLTVTEGDLVKAFVTRLYRVCLDREPDEAGLDSWADQLRSGKITGVKAAQGFIFSQEFKNKNYCNRHFVQQLYRAFMGREPDEGGWNNWIRQLESGSTREAVFNGFALSPEFTLLCNEYGITRGGAIGVGRWGTVPTGPCRWEGCGEEDGVTQFVKRLYRVCLDRDADAGGLSDWTKQLWEHTSTGKKVAYGFVFSAEFQGKKYDNGTFVDYMYLAFFDREADAAGRADWVSQLAAGKSRVAVFNGFADSKEFTNLCAKYGILAR